jgi:hypothetical protein
MIEWLERKVRRRRPTAECTCHKHGAEVHLRLDFTSTAEKSSASLYSTKHLVDRCYRAVYIHHASRPAFGYAIEISPGLHRPAGHSKVI